MTILEFVLLFFCCCVIFFGIGTAVSNYIIACWWVCKEEYMKKMTKAVGEAFTNMSESHKKHDV